MLFLTTITWMFLLANSLRSRVLAFDFRPIMFTNSASLTFFQTIAEVIGNQILNVFAHVSYSFRLALGMTYG